AGALPPNPYHYLRPPAALAAENQPPAAGTRILTVEYMRHNSWVFFTPDNQAGIAATRGVFAMLPSTSEVEISIRPVQSPPGLPGGLVVDGNAYSFSAVQRPSGLPAALTGHVYVTLKYPHLPLDIYWHAST